MSNLRELRALSLDFRRLSSGFLNSTDDNASTMIQRFKVFIDGKQFVRDLIHNTIDGVEYDYDDCFKSQEHSGWSEVVPPIDEAFHVKAMYDYLGAIADNGGNVCGAAMSYYCSSRKIDDIIQSFVDEAFKPLIDFVVDSISKEIMLLEEDAKTAAPAMLQNIGTVNGTVVQGTGSITSTNTTISNDVQAILQMIERLTPAVDKMDIDEADKDSIKDDLEVISEQLNSASPKKNRLQKSLSGIKKFTNDFGMQLAVTLAANAVTGVDWSALIANLEAVIARL